MENQTTTQPVDEGIILREGPEEEAK